MAVPNLTRKGGNKKPDYEVLSTQILQKAAEVAEMVFPFSVHFHRHLPFVPRVEGSSEYLLAGWTKVSSPAYFARLT